MIIAFTGHIKSGKTEACKYLELRGFTKVGFKDAMLEEMKEMFPDFLELVAGFYHTTIDDLFKIKPIEIRRFMQNYGTDLRRREDVNYWVKKWEDSQIDIFDTCVDDCRFLNEAKAIKKYKGIIIRLIRDTGDSGTHASETEMSKIKEDFKIDNNGTKQDLYLKIDEILKKYGYV
jgi:dephospho-CoA kinase